MVQKKAPESYNVDYSTNPFRIFIEKNKKSLIIWIVSILAIFVVAGLWGIWYISSQTDPNVLALVGENKITKQDLNKAIYSFDMQGTIDNPTYKPSDKERKNLLNELVEKNIVRQEAKKAGISVKTQDVIDQIKLNDKDYDRRTLSDRQLIYDNQEYNLLLEKVENNKFSFVDGKYLLVRFDKYLSGPYKDSAKYEQEKSQASALANSIYDKLKGKSISFEEAQKLVQDDPNLGKPSFDKINQEVLISGELNKDVYQLGLGPTVMSDFNVLIDNTKVGQTTKPTVIKVDVIDPNTKKTTQEDGVYAIAMVTNKNPGESSNYNDWIKIKKTEYIKTNSFQSWVNKYLYPNKAYALAGAGGLVPTGDSSPAGFFVMFNYYDAGGGRHTDFNSDVKFTNDGGGTYSWSGNTKYCTSASFVETTGTDSFASTKTFSSPSPSDAGTGWVKMGYDSRGGNSWSLICSCKNTYTAQFIYNTYGSDPGNGNWVSVKYYFTNGSTTDYSTDSTFSFSAIANGYTAGLYANYQANRPPVPGHVTPAPSQTYTLAAGESDLASLTFQGFATDPDSDQIALRAAYYKETSPGVYGGPNYVPASSYSGWYPENAGAHNIGTAYNLTPGKYKWRVWAQDAHGQLNSAGGSDNSVSGAAGEWVFHINAAPHTITPSADPGCNISPNTAQVISDGDSAAFTGSANTGYTFNGFSKDGAAVQADGSFTNVIADHTINADCSINTYTLSYDANGGSGAPGSAVYNYGSNAPVSGTVPTRNLYNFVGWNTNAAGTGTNYSSGNLINMTSNLILYAKWTPASCSVSLSITPTSMNANTGTPTLTASVSQGTSGSINFGDTNTTSLANLSGTNSLTHTYNGFGVFNATASCVGQDGVTRTSSALFELKKIQSACTVSAIATSINGGTGNFVSDNASGYTVTSINNGAVDLNMTTVAAATTGAVSEYWTSTNGLNNSSNKVTKKSSGAYSPWAGAVNTLRFANPDTYTITTQCFTPDQYGSYSPPGNPGSTATKKVILNRPACKYNDPLNPIKVEASSYNTASGHPMASNMNPSTIKFSANNLSGVGATGFIQWDLYNGVTPISHTGQASTDSPSITYYFSGSGTGDRSGRDSSNTLPATATYTVKLIASSMTDAFGGVILPRPSDPGNCDSNVAVTVDRGPEIACDMSPSSGGIVPQAISVTVRADSSVYRNNANDFTLNWNSHTKSFNGSLDNSFSPARIIATVSQMLENTGKYNISVVATKLDGSKEAPFACGGLDLTGSCPWGTGKCNYVVTNPGGGGGGEVAP